MSRSFSSLKASCLVYNIIPIQECQSKVHLHGSMHLSNSINVIIDDTQLESQCENPCSNSCRTFIYQGRGGAPYRVNGYNTSSPLTKSRPLYKTSSKKYLTNMLEQRKVTVHHTLQGENRTTGFLIRVPRRTGVCGCIAGSGRTVTPVLVLEWAPWCLLSPETVVNSAPTSGEHTAGAAVASAAGSLVSTADGSTLAVLGQVVSEGPGPPDKLWGCGAPRM